eukprot:581675-Prymnesium_polylepis.1
MQPLFKPGGDTVTPPRRRVPAVPRRHAPPHTASRRCAGRCARAAHPGLLRRSVRAAGSRANSRLRHRDAEGRSPAALRRRAAVHRHPRP